ncbi:bone marrow proteoglycan [Grus americana]|uniref:bone marrow proteoglycan n=1 Tax=Grus americana TaxID=9117 RepID=UPI0024088A83|nr:bone marrow proteoglycan [Grus americana]XP_054685013.1 bone marrow proteoglycan [Grus americana]
MQPCLLLVLALLGSASASPPAPASPEAEDAALEVPEEEEEDGRCPLESETRALSIPNALGATTTFRYVIVTRCQSFRRAQRTCARCYRGRLASIHSYSINVFLQRQARLCTNRGQVWIGAITWPLGRRLRCRWSDRSAWNYSYWLRGYPLRSRRYCTSLCTNNGRWRSLRCRVRLPFICEY